MLVNGQNRTLIGVTEVMLTILRALVNRNRFIALTHLGIIQFPTFNLRRFYCKANLSLSLKFPRISKVSFSLF